MPRLPAPLFGSRYHHWKLLQVPGPRSRFGFVAPPSLMISEKDPSHELVEVPPEDCRSVRPSGGVTHSVPPEKGSAVAPLTPKNRMPFLKPWTSRARALKSMAPEMGALSGPADAIWARQPAELALAVQ